MRIRALKRRLGNDASPEGLTPPLERNTAHGACGPTQRTRDTAQPVLIPHHESVTPRYESVISGYEVVIPRYESMKPRHASVIPRYESI